MSKNWQGGSTRRWRRIRAAVLLRDGNLCQLKLEGCTTVAEHVHHVIGKAAGDDPAHLTSACAHCNLKLGSPTRHDPPPQPRTRW